jgi:two-component system phosphate regulon sensor histidine kinase PhoR
MKPRVLVSILSFVCALVVSGLSYLLDKNLMHVLLIFSSAFLVSFFLFYVAIERYIYHKIKLVYKLISDLKMDKDLKEVIGDYLSDDPIRDVEEQVKDWARVKKTEIDRLKSVEHYRKEFLANISHEFKTPLFSIQGYVQSLLDEDLQDVEMVRGFLTKTNRNIERLVVLVQDLDEISKLESGQVKLNLAPFDFGALVNEVMESFEEKARSKGLKLRFVREPGFKPKVLADREKIRQIITNLIDNSLKYGNEGGWTEVRCFEMGDKVLIEVSDNGIGIDEQNLPRVFERFFRTDASRARSVGGSGLGLAIVKHIVEAHGQTIHVRSTLGVGTTFVFTLDRYLR